MDLFQTPLSAPEIGELCRKLGLPPRALLRTKDPAYEAHGLAEGQHSDPELLELMAGNPGLIQRPIVVDGARAVLGRPLEAVAKLLG